MKNFLSILILSFFIISGENASYITVNNNSCGDILSLEGKETAKQQVIRYMSGYITGRNYETNGKVGSGGSHEALYWAIIKYCKNNPLKKMSDAAEDLYFKLKN